MGKGEFITVEDMVTRSNIRHYFFRFLEKPHHWYEVMSHSDISAME